MGNEELRDCYSCGHYSMDVSGCDPIMPKCEGHKYWCRSGQGKPTVDQVAWVFEKIMANAGKGTFRYLIYDLMSFTDDDYMTLYRAGGMAINNAMDIVYGEEEPEKHQTPV